MPLAPSRRAAAIRPSLIRRLFNARKPTSVNLGLGEPGMPVPMELLDAGIERFRRDRPGYTANAGMPELRQKILDHHRSPRRVDDVIVTVGLQEALFVTLLAIADPGDEIVITDPTFLAYRTVAELLGLTVVTAPLDRSRQFSLDAAAIARVVGPKTRAVLINSPANPTGRIHGEAELRALCEAAPDVWLISDEIYRELYYTDAPPPSLGDLTDRAIVLGALSKSCSMTGFRLGWTIAPPALSSAIAAVHQFNVTCAPAISQCLALEAFNDSRWLSSLRPQFARQREAMLRAIDDELGLPYVPSEGGFFAFVDVSERHPDSLALAEALLAQADVVTVPGAAFGAGGEGFLRLSYGGDVAAIHEGVKRIARFLR